jgi:presenilin 1
MIEAAQSQNIEIPSALIYSAMVWMMATPGKPIINTNQQQPVESERSPILVAVESTSDNNRRNTSSHNSSLHDSTTELVTPTHERTPIEMQDLSQNNTRNVQNEEEDDDEEHSLKLGVGDFVFYSVLVGRSSLYDWITTIGTIISVFAGLVMTIMILVIKKRPLPALPISILLGILVFLVTSLTLSPMIESLVVISAPTDLLRAGSQNAGLLFL